MATVVAEKGKEQAGEPINFQIEVRPVRTDRIERMLDYVNSVHAGVCVERARYYTESYKRTESRPQIVRRALALKHALENISLYLLPGSLLMGNQASKPNYSPIFPEFTTDFLKREIFDRKPYYPPERPSDKFQIDDKVLPELSSILDYWQGKTHKERVYARLPKEALIAQDSIGAINILNYVSGGDGHFAPPYKWHIEHGLGYVIRTSREKLAALDITTGEGLEQKAFYEATIIACEAVIKWAHRYADLAEAEAAKEKDPERKRELAKMTEIARWVPENPARNFHEALQLVTFIQLAIQVEDNAQGVCLGRFDQVMIDMYEKGIAVKELTREKALELVQNFFVMLSVIERIRSWEDTQFFRGKPIFQNLTIGGINPETHQDATNEMTYIILDAIQNTRTIQPSHYARWHRTAPDKYKMKVAETIRLGTGFPAVANDEMYIQAMLNRGYEYKDAADYCIIGCAEPGPAGRRGGRTGAAWFSMAKCLEMALYNGHDPVSGKILNPNSCGRDLASFESYDQVWASFVGQVLYYLRFHAIMDNAIDLTYEEYIDEPLGGVMACPETTIERGRSIKKGGAKYDFTGNQTIGLANVANSLYAIRKLVFEDRVLSGEQLLRAMRTNFEDLKTDPTGPEIRQMCLSVSKYGNDVDEVDFIARDALALVCTELPKYKNTRYGRGPIGGVFQASTTTVSSNTPFGHSIGALPDGRVAQAPLSDGQSPFRGSDTLGPTAALNSVSKLNLVLLSEGSLYNMKLFPADLKD
jgi:pyruvate formate-lyase/glycerol dehydratase family glycyl radical enzyme